MTSAIDNQNATKHSIDSADPIRLRHLLEQYNQDSDADALRAAFYIKQQEHRKPFSFLDSLSTAFASFTLTPSRNRRYLPQPLSNAHAIASYWGNVGEYLSYGMIQYVITKENGNEQEEQES